MIQWNTIDERWEEVHSQKHRSLEKSFNYKVLLKDGRFYRDYKLERARELFEREGVRLYAYTMNVFPITILIDAK